MSQQLLDQLREKSDNLNNIYGARFAGYSRLTRDLGEMDGLIQGAKEVLEQGVSLQGAAAQELLETARQRLDLYERERQAIVQAKEAGPQAQKAVDLGSQANRVFQIYRRHFAGKNRATRDLGLLAEMIDDLTGIRAQMETLAREFDNEGLRRDIEVVNNNINMYVTERGEITNARNAGTVNQQADQLAELANDQFSLYQKHFAGRSRRTRRAGLLQRIINNLEALRDRMRTLSSGGLQDATHQENARVVSGQIDFYKTELAAVLNAQKEISANDRGGLLGEEANSIMAEYRENFAGQNRATRDVELLVLLCDRMQDVERQMHKLATSNAELDFNHRNLQIVRDNMTLFNRELDAIKEAKAP